MWLNRAKCTYVMKTEKGVTILLLLLQCFCRITSWLIGTIRFSLKWVCLHSTISFFCPFCWPRVGWPLQLLAGPDPLVLDRAEAPGKYTLPNEGDRHAILQCRDGSPLARPLLPSWVTDLLHQRSAVSVLQRAIFTNPIFKLIHKLIFLIKVIKTWFHVRCC